MSKIKKYFWLKVGKSFFDQKEIKKLRKISGGDTFVIIYLKLGILSLENNGILIYEGVESTFADELSLVIDENPDNIQITLNFLITHGMLEENCDEFFLNRISEMSGKETDAAKRMRLMRSRKCNNVTDLSLTCDKKVTTEIELDIEKEIDNKSRSVCSEKIRTPYNEIVELYNTHCNKLKGIRDLTDARRTLLRKLFIYMQEDLKKMSDYFDTANNTPFLCGDNDRGWIADFDFIARVDKAIVILEGKYGVVETVDPELEEFKKQVADRTKF